MKYREVESRRGRDFPRFHSPKSSSEFEAKQSWLELTSFFDGNIVVKPNLWTVARRRRKILCFFIWITLPKCISTRGPEYSRSENTENFRLRRAPPHVICFSRTCDELKTSFLNVSELSAFFKNKKQKTSKKSGYYPPLFSRLRKQGGVIIQGGVIT